MAEPSEEIVFEATKKDIEDRSDVDPSELESIRNASQKMGGITNAVDAVADAETESLSALFNSRRFRSRTSKTLEMLQLELSELSGLVLHKEEDEKDRGIIARTLAEVGEHGYGLLGVSVWLLDSESDKLHPKGWWYEPSMPKSKAFDRLFDDSKVNYVPQKPVLPGADLAGILWYEASEYDMAGRASEIRKSSIFRRLSSVGRNSASVRGSVSPPSNRNSRRLSSVIRNSSSVRGSVSPPSKRSSFFAGLRSSNSTGRRGSSVTPGRRRRSSVSELLFPSREPEEILKWRDLKSLVDDPYTAKGPRLALLEKAGFHKAAGITFQNDICQGIVIYYIKNDLEEDTLNSIPNISYLKISAEMIGSCASMVRTRRATVGHAIKTGRTHEFVVDSPANEKNKTEKDHRSLIPRRIKKLKNKIQGGGMQIPPSPNMIHASWTTFGTLIGLLVLSSLNQYIKYLSEDEFYFVLGPFGALLTLQYALTAAPASQPRNAILGQALAGGTAMLFTYIPESALPVWIRVVIAPAIAIGLMVKCGFTHPPGGAHAVIIASGKISWAMYGFGLLGTFASIFPALLINNLSDKRQYPTYWGFVLPAWLEKVKKISKDKKKLIPLKKLNAKQLSETNPNESDSSDKEEV